MTRIIVKNLPNSITAEKLKETFSKKGQITDLQLKYAADGKFRGFAFVGYKSEEEADEALRFFNNTYIGSMKVLVQKCVNLGELKRGKKGQAPELPKATLEKKSEPASEVDPEFSEFLKVHSKNQAEKNIWSNDTLGLAVDNRSSIAPAAENEEPEDKSKEAHKKELSDLEYLKSKMVVAEGGEKAPQTEPVAKADFLTVKVRGFGFQSKKKDVKKFFNPLKLDSIRLPRKVKGVAYVGFSSEKDFKQAINKNRSFYDGNRIFVTKYEKKVKQDVEDGEETAGKGNKKDAWLQQENELKKEETIAESGRIFIRNLPYSTNEDELQALFSPFGPIAEIHLPVDKYSRKVKGFAFVMFVFPEHALAAYAKLDGTVFQGRMLHLLAGKGKLNTEQDSDEPTSYKQKKAKEQKAQAGSSHNWNTLFLGANAVATLMAERYGTTKQQVLLGTSEEEGRREQQSVAVRLALGETQIVAETKQFLIDNGIQLQVFEQAAKQRSKTVILVKNLSAGVSVEQLRLLFSPFGEIGRLLLPPNGVTAIVEFLEPTEARSAFRKLAYSKLNDTPLYLEWAPVDMFSKGKPSTSSSAESKDETGAGGQHDQPEPDAVLFVKNLNFATTDDVLRRHFESCGNILSATVAKKKDPKKPGQMLSMGYGFVQFATKNGATEALKQLQNSKLDEHVIELKRSHKTQDNKGETIAAMKKTSKVTNEPISSKLLVRNIPFEAKTSEVADLFKPFGELKAVRLPKKSAASSQHRGFAFIDFLTKQDAKRAFESLSASTHLYGRRLVVEWAAEEETVEDIRRRTASHFVEGPSAKRQKKAVGEMEATAADDSD